MERVGGNATDLKVAALSRSFSDVLAHATSHPPEEWVDGEAADAVVSHPTPHSLRSGWAVLGRALSHPTLPGSMRYEQDRGTATLRPQSS